MLNEIISTVLQLAVFTLIPYIGYRFFYKNKSGFLNYIGLIKSPIKPLIYALAFSIPLMVLLLLLIHNSPELTDAMNNPKSMTGKFKAMGIGVNTFVLIAMAAIFKTALAEEILFRGFIAKRFISMLGFHKGNLLQAVLFGVIHSLLFLSITQNILFLLLIFIFPFTVAMVITWLNEKQANGSIFPGWLAHASGNLLSYLFYTLF